MDTSSHVSQCYTGRVPSNPLTRGTGHACLPSSSCWGVVKRECAHSCGFCSYTAFNTAAAGVVVCVLFVIGSGSVYVLSRHNCFNMDDCKQCYSWKLNWN